MYIADLHIHSKYSRATSRDGVPEYLELWAHRKGISLLGTGDFTHPAWREELRNKLAPAEDGLYTLREGLRLPDETAGGETHPRFVVSGEISSIYKKNDKVRKVHNLILLPSLDAAETLSRRLEAIGNIHSDGRPILGLDSRDLLEITLDACPDAILFSGRGRGGIKGLAIPPHQPPTENCPWQFATHARKRPEPSGSGLLKFGSSLFKGLRGAGAGPRRGPALTSGSIAHPGGYP